MEGIKQKASAAVRSHPLVAAGLIVVLAILVLYLMFRGRKEAKEGALFKNRYRHMREGAEDGAATAAAAAPPVATGDPSVAAIPVGNSGGTAAQTAGSASQGSGSGIFSTDVDCARSTDPAAIAEARGIDKLNGLA
jgi:hypothetical protein